MLPDPFQLAQTFYRETEGLDDVTRMQHIDLNLWMPGDILAKADKMTMAHSLELRVPFLDKELFEVARKIPAKYRIAEGTTKYVFRKAMEGNRPRFHSPSSQARLPGTFAKLVMRSGRRSGAGADRLRVCTSIFQQRVCRADVPSCTVMEKLIFPAICGRSIFFRSGTSSFSLRNGAKRNRQAVKRSG